MRKNTFKLKKIMLAGVLALVGLFSVVFGSVAPAKVNASVGDWYETEIEGVYNVDGDLYLGSDYEDIFYRKSFIVEKGNSDSFQTEYLNAEMGENGFESILISNIYHWITYYIFDIYNEKETLNIFFYTEEKNFDLVEMIKTIYPDYNFGYYIYLLSVSALNRSFYPTIDTDSISGIDSNAYPGETAYTFTLTDYMFNDSFISAKINHAVGFSISMSNAESNNTFFPCGKYLWNETLLPQNQTITPDQTEYETSFMTANNIFFETFSTVTDIDDTLMCYEIMGDKFPLYSFTAQMWNPNINADQYRIFEYVWDGSDEIWQQDAVALTLYFWEESEEVPIFIKNNAQQLIKLYKEPEEPEPPAPPIEPPTAEPNPKAITYGIIIFVILLAAAVFVLSSKARK